MNSMERAQRRRRQRRRRQPRRERRQERLQQGGSRSARARGRAASTSWTFISVLAQFSVKRSFLYGVVAIILGMFVVAFVDSRGWIDGDGPGFWAIVINIGIVTYSMAAVGGDKPPALQEGLAGMEVAEGGREQATFRNLRRRNSLRMPLWPRLR